MGAEQEDSIREQGFPSGGCSKYFMFNRDFNQKSSIFISSVFPSIPEKAVAEFIVPLQESLI